MRITKPIESTTEPPHIGKLRERVQKISTIELIDWAETTVNGIGLCLMDFRGGRGTDPGKSPLEEALLGADALRVVIEEIQRRV